MPELSLTTAIVALAIAAVVFFLRRHFLYLFKPPLRIRLAPGAPVSQIEARWPELESLGFERIGDYTMPEMPGVKLSAYVQKFQRVTAVVYKHPIVGVFADMFSATEDDEGLTVSSAPMGGELDTPPRRVKVFDKSLSIAQIYDRLLKERPRGPYRLVDERDFVQVFEKEYADEMEWRRQRGGVTVDEVRRTSEAMGLKTSEKKLQQTARRIGSDYEKSWQELQQQKQD